MNLPHLPPIKFATETLTCKDQQATVRCEFPTLPTLAMLVEAAAQSTMAVLNTDVAMNGFLVLIKDTVLHVKPKSLIAIVEVEMRLSLGNSSEFYFEVLEKPAGERYASGSFVIVLEERLG